MMRTKLHAIVGTLAFCCVATFWSATTLAEGFLDLPTITWVKVAITQALWLFVPCMALVGATGFSLGGRSTHPLVLAKRRRMPLIAANGLLVLTPAALFLSAKAQTGAFDAAFYAVQTLEWFAGATNLWLMGSNIRDGRRLRQQSQGTA